MILIEVHQPCSIGRRSPSPFPDAPNLKCLSLKDILITNRHIRPSAHGQRIKAALQRVSSNCLDEFIVSFVNVKIEDLLLLQVHEWLECLNLPQFASLKRIVYQCAGPSLTDQAEQVKNHILRAHEPLANKDVMIQVAVENSLR